MWGPDFASKYFSDGAKLVNNAIAMDKSGNIEHAKQFYLQASSKFNLCINCQGVSKSLKDKAQECKQKCDRRYDELIEPKYPLMPHQEENLVVVQHKIKVIQIHQEKRKI